ncbi:MAG: glycoside hydrolase family 5 protein [Tractidigestivibacter sp.]|jgi:glucan 1,3-beta-glucosidase|uniref:glycoside hydrolase family 5 protein n=1 Tax=Tractidigestivibacter sp. TaxID=2847320 RepID=UPI003D8F541F
MADGHLHGVNLTGWLTLEPWVTPELFAQSGSLDEETLARNLGRRRYADVVSAHRSSFIQRNDFVQIASRGFNAVRLPVPWYVFGRKGPEPGPYQGCIDYVDQALDWAEEIGLHVIFAFVINAGAPNSGNGISPDLADCHVPRSEILRVIGTFCKRYAFRMGFYGIEVADAVVPQVRRGLMVTDGVPAHRLRNYYRDAYEVVRNACGDDVLVILPDGGVPALWGRFMAQTHYKNVWLDVQLDNPPQGVDVGGPSGIRKVMDAQNAHIRAAMRTGMPVMVGKWSSALPLADSDMTPEGRVALERIYSSEQIALYGKRPAWFFNTWKTSGLLASWDARVTLATFERGMIV